MSVRDYWEGVAVVFLPPPWYWVRPSPASPTALSPAPQDFQGGDGEGREAKGHLLWE